MNVLLIDTETTGLNFEKDRIIEIGAIATGNDFTEVLGSVSVLVHDVDYPPLTEEIQKLTGIKPDMFDAAYVPGDALAVVENLMRTHACSMIVAYNASFDRQMIVAEANRHGSLGLHWEKPWVCAMRDLEGNKEFKCLRLSHLALDKGIAVDPASLHRAIDDVELMRKMLVKSQVTAKDLYAYSQVPYIFVAALVPHPREPDSAEKRELAKKHGYSWQQVKDDPRVFEKRWVKKIKETDLEKEKQSCPLVIRVI